jgi:hypothetical protein
MSNNKGILSYKNVDPRNFVASELQKGDSQESAYINYMVNDRSTRPLIQTPWINMKTYGIPESGNKHYDTELKRAFLKFPLNNEMDKKGEDATGGEKKFTKLLQNMDKHFDSTEFKNKLFGGAIKAKKYVYSGVVKSPVEMEEPEKDDKEEYEKWEKQQKQYRPLFMKAKIHLEVDYSDPKDRKINKILTVVRVRHEDGTKEKLNVQSLDDIDRYVRYGSQVRMIIAPSRLWANKSPMAGSKDKLYGVQFKIIQIEVIPPKGKGQEKLDTNDDLMISDSDDEEEKNKYESDSDDDSDDDTEDD